jgi:DNA-binding response OmpR family regulator
MSKCKKPSLLIVKDQADARKLIHVASQGPNCRLESTGLEALAKVRKVDPGNARLDFCQPAPLNGFDLCKEIKNMNRNTRTFVTLIAGMNDQKDYEKKLRVGAYIYFVKPLSPAGLTQLVQNHRWLKNQGTLHPSMQNWSTFIYR